MNSNPLRNMHEEHLLKILFSAADTVFEKNVEKMSSSGYNSENLEQYELHAQRNVN
jgi:hypothetical protein